MVVYLAGGINGLSDAECREWRNKAAALLRCYTRDPMRRDYRGKELEHAEEIVLADLEDIRNSDFVLVNALRPSWGTAMEIVYAKKLGKEVLAFVGDAKVSPWRKYHCEIYRTLEEACEVINMKEEKWWPCQIG